MTPPYDPSAPSGPQARKRAFRLLFLCLMATGVGNSMLFAILPPLARELGVAEVYVGAIYTLSALMFLTMSPVWGALSDRYGRRPLIVFGLSSFAFSTLVFAAGAWAGRQACWRRWPPSWRWRWRDACSAASVRRPIPPLRPMSPTAPRLWNARRRSRA